MTAVWLFLMFFVGSTAAAVKAGATVFVNVSTACSGVIVGRFGSLSDERLLPNALIISDWSAAKVILRPLSTVLS